MAIRFLYNNLYTAAATVLSASSSQSGFPVGASQNTDRSYTWRSNSTASTENIVIDLGAAQALTCVALANYNIRSGGTLKLYEGGSGGAPGAYNLVATLTAQDSLTRVGYAFFSSNSKRWWKLEWTTAGTDYAEVGYVFLGTYYEPRNPVHPSIEQADPSIGRQSIDGQTTFATRTNYAMGQFTWPVLTETDLGNFQTIYSAVGIKTPIFVVLDTATSWMAWLLRLVGSIKKTVLNAAPIRVYEVVISWEESR